jgi:integrase
VLKFKLGDFPEISPEQASKLALGISAKIASGVDPRQERKEAREEATLAELFAYYMEQHAKPKKKTWAEDAAMFERYCSKIKSYRISAITHEVVRKLHAGIGQNHGPYAANRLVALLSKVFSFAKGSNPCRGIERFRERQRDRFLRPDEVGRFLSALDEESPTVRDYFNLALLVGARRGNLQSMRWDQLHLDDGEWRIPDTKTGEPQTVYLHPVAVAILRRRQEGSESAFVFPSREGAKLPYLTFQYKAWRSICKRAGLTGLRPHDLRRSLASWELATGANLVTIGKTLGHRPGSSATSIYARADLTAVRKAVDTAVSAMLAAANGGKEATHDGRQ